MEELSLDLAQEPCVIVEFKVDNLASFDVDYNLARVGASHKNPTLV